MSESRERVWQPDDGTGWEALGTAGAFIKILWENPENGASIALFRVDKGGGVPTTHIHASNQFMYCLKGKYHYPNSNIVLTPGMFYMNPKDNEHGPTYAEEDCLLVEIYDGPHYYETPAFAVHQGEVS